jgi:hypothetical protein
MERRRPNRELKNSEDVQDAIIEDYFRYDDLSRMEADNILMNISEIEGPNYEYTPFLWYRGFYDTAVFILSVPMHCSATRRFFYLYIHKHNSHIYRNVWSFCPNVLNFCKYTHFYLFLRNSGHFYFTLIPCFVKCPIIKP